MAVKTLVTAAAVGLVAAAGLSAPAQAAEPSCWGQASKVFAQSGEMGSHSSNQATPRIGLANLARVLADAGVIPDGTMAELGVFVSTELGLSIDAC